MVDVRVVGKRLLWSAGKGSCSCSFLLYARISEAAATHVLSV